MYNPSYEPETDFVPTPEITVAEARHKAKYHEALVKSPNFDISTDSGRYDWECMNFYNQIILKSNLKRRANGHLPTES